MGLIGSLKRKCGTCGAKVKRSEMYRVNMTMQDGKTSVMICEDCASSLLVSDDDMQEHLGGVE